MPELRTLYIDASALVKLVVLEPETPTLRASIPSDARLVSSEIARVEVLRAVRRRLGDAAVEPARSRLEGVRLLPLSQSICRRACALEPDSLRSLDAIHIATALELGNLLDGVYAYDQRLIEAATREGLPMLTPTPTGEPPS